MEEFQEGQRPLAATRVYRAVLRGDPHGAPGCVNRARMGPTPGAACLEKPGEDTLGG